MKRTPIVLVLFILATILTAACSVTTTAPAPRPSGNLVQIGFESSPSGAEIWVDGEFVGSTNLNYALAPGKRVVEIRKAGFETWRRELTVRENTPTRVRADLAQLPR